ncbi:MAG TPA: hypothetical protein HA362_05845 [Nanoarchaeota archaeon]|nr:hypothetical protein [Nanoarchaeota archaeon]
MEKEKPGGLENLLETVPRQSHGSFLSFLKPLPDYAISAVAGIGLAVALYVGGMSAYHAVDEFLSVDESMVAAAKASEEPSPYSGCEVYCMILGMCAIGAASFGYAMVASVKGANEKIEEERKKE